MFGFDCCAWLTAGNNADAENNKSAAANSRALILPDTVDVVTQFPVYARA